ncbi:MAG: transcriptional repressor LexA [Patescibacteria group bacterium]
MKSTITERQKQLLHIIYGFLTHTGYPPTFEEMREKLDVASNQSVTDLLEKLSSQGYVRKGSGARSLAITPLGYKTLERPVLAPVLGTTAAGLPVEAVEIPGAWQRLSDQEARLADEVFMLKISGDSMINAGIDDGDAVLVQVRKEFVSGDVVYAQIGDEGTVKRFISEDKPPYVYLKPENPHYGNILFTDSVELKGKVVSVLKGNAWYPIR